MTSGMTEDLPLIWWFFGISGANGAWKNTQIARIIEKYEQCSQVLSCKSREPRINEILWIDYHKLPIEYFKQSFVHANPMYRLECVYHDDYGIESWYGTRLEDVIECIKRWKRVVKEIEPVWYEIACKSLDKLHIPHFMIFLDISDDEIERRMRSRDPNESEVRIKWSIQRSRMEREMVLERQKNFNDSLIIQWSGTKDDVFEEVSWAIAKFCGIQ